MALLTEKRVKKTPAPASDSSPGESESEGSQNSAGEAEGNAGWADSIQKVLKTTKPKTQKKTVLARAKKSQAAVRFQKAGTNKKPGFDFEIEKADVNEEDEDDNDDDDEDEKPQASALDATLTKQQRKNVPLQLRVKPSFQDMERERTLRKVATRGVVQFFNAVRIQQKDLQQQLEEAGPLDSRQDAVLNNINKRKFLDVLMSGKRSKSTPVDNAVKKEEQETDDDDDDESSSGKKKSEWSVLREDFMTNKKIKHWDEEDDDEEGHNDEADDSDYDDGEE
ncbi:RRP15-like protein [Drosophila sechellia]|uniref:RRP15-like protein n=1 Tax=Drosophila sechellia TaxID=7238 RepID=B4HE35_DROSE|nr:RRP15-like protein [Drosophila sechellia]EDW42127.1 GM24193 [Drosophila sechellia]